jgi:hypothetical protein
MITIAQIEAAARDVAQAAGFTIHLVGTRFNASGMTTFLWDFYKDGKTYRMQDEVNLRDVEESQLSLWGTVFMVDMVTAEEVT